METQTAPKAASINMSTCHGKVLQSACASTCQEENNWKTSEQSHESENR